MTQDSGQLVQQFQEAAEIANRCIKLAEDLDSLTFGMLARQLSMSMSGYALVLIDPAHGKEVLDSHLEVLQKLLDKLETRIIKNMEQATE